MTRDHTEIAYFVLGRSDEFGPYSRACAAAIVLNSRGVEVSAPALQLFIDELPDEHAAEITRFWSDDRPGRPGRIHITAQVRRAHDVATGSPVYSGTA